MFFFISAVQVGEILMDKKPVQIRYLFFQMGSEREGDGRHKEVPGHAERGHAGASAGWRPGGGPASSLSCRTELRRFVRGKDSSHVRRVTLKVNKADNIYV